MSALPISWEESTDYECLVAGATPATGLFVMCVVDFAFLKPELVLLLQQRATQHGPGAPMHVACRDWGHPQ